MNSHTSKNDLLQSWLVKLDNATISVLPEDYLRPQEPPFVNQRRKTVDICNIAQFRDKDVYVAALTTWIILVHRFTSDEDITCYVGNNKAIRLTVSPLETFEELYLKLYSELEQLQQLEGVDFDRLSAYIQEKRGLESPPCLARFGFVSTPQPKLERFEYSPFDILLNLVNNSTLEIYYNSLLYTDGRIDILGSQFKELLFQGLDRGAEEITKFSLLTAAARVNLPDPTEDLEWKNFRGSIQDIFQANARRYPDKRCITETPCSEWKTSRYFTYGVLDRASNIVAHYLIQTGIRRSDVVMIYSSRGAELVVCIMGILKAGATFSVIDPAYPPARQTIYLDVAKPKGLIVISSAGELDEIVKKFIKEKLEVVSFIPSLYLTSDGCVRGGVKEHSAFDCLDAVLSLSETPTDIVVGPDSNPTLSFTSGSEGIPKGVLGRHFSLTYYFDWMSKEFGLSENDKFTMLSGIAHDPIQRDIFTPLFLGAEILIPSADDIGTPGQLAKWMAKYGATVTHLTPAMGQLLTAEATDYFPKLHHAFFVGDILTKRDCRRLQALAENVHIVNMYGTTETQRAVSYFVVKSKRSDPSFLDSMKDTMPAGKGMHNVQLLVVNRHNRQAICGVGEVGEIYVRAAGLAEGYRHLGDLNKIKFVDNWFVSKNHWASHDVEKDVPWREFWLGPRDRLYRTGDLGRYLPDGNCECCGRADDQVKIRGFRIELGEIDTHISRHALICQNVTLVRKTPDNETALIAFMVPRFDQSDLTKFTSSVPDEVHDPEVRSFIKYEKLVKDLRDYLKKRLPSYAIPSTFIVMKELPLNPNGKVDKPKLQYPTRAQMDMVSMYSQLSIALELTPLEREVLDLWFSILPSKPILTSCDDSFFDMGGHSILATKMIFEARKKFKVNLLLSTIFKAPTIRLFANEISNAKKHIPVMSEDTENETSEYYEDAVKLLNSLIPSSYPSCDPFPMQSHQPTTITVFLTGATGFLGSYIIADLLSRPVSPVNVKLYVHVRACDEETALQRLRTAGKAYGTWSDSFENRLDIVLGDLSKKCFGLGKNVWEELSNKVDIVIHNAALVHWLYPYSALRDANVIGTINVMDLATRGKAKYFTFISSTSVLDSEHYFSLSEKLVREGGQGILESDDLQGSKMDLVGGYGQSKWVAEYLVRAAGKRGLRGSIVRPGYVTGCSHNGSSNTDDFLLRFMKGAVQLGKIPDIRNTVNMVPVDHVARIVTASSFYPPSQEEISVVHVTGHPRMLFKDYLLELATYGYKVEIVPYESWRHYLEEAVLIKGQENALYPLLHMVLENLPEKTRAPELEDANAMVSLKRDIQSSGLTNSAGMGMTRRQIGIYISFLVKTGYLPKPPQGGKLKLPDVQVTSEQINLVLKGVAARSSAAQK